jgi:hypothetical protein
VAATFFLFSVYIAYEAIRALLTREGPDSSTVVLGAISLLMMPTLAYLKGSTGCEMSRATVVERDGDVHTTRGC